MNSEMFHLNLNDFAKGAVTAVISAVVMSLAGIMSNGFDVFNADWHAILNLAINSAIAAFLGYMGKNLLSDSDGRVLGKIG